jgi:hypothetical protein
MNGLWKIWNDIRKGENLDVYLAIGVSLVVAIWGLFSGSFKESAMLMVLGAISVGVLVNRQTNEKIKELIEHRQSELNSSSIQDMIAENNNAVIQALNGVNITTYTTSAEYSQYKAKRLRQAKRIDDVTWRFHGYDVQTRSQGESQALKNLDEITKEIIKKDGVVWREVVVFRTKAQLEHELSLLKNPENIAYNFGFYPILPTSQNPPRVGFMIIDNEELFIAYASTSKWLAIRHPDLISVFSAYFNDIWREAEKVKIGNQVDQKKLELAELIFS